MLNPKQCVLYSGGAAGTEQFFGALAEGWGIEEVNYSFEGHQIERKRGVRVLTSEELALKDVSLRVLPVSPREVKRMVGELRGVSLLQGFRGAAPVDLDALAESVARIGDAALALGDTLDTLEVNPLRADGARIEALDALATYRRA